MADFNTMSKVARICIIGNGEFANKVHFPSLASLKNVVIVGLCAFNEEKLKITAARYKIAEDAVFVARTPTDYRKMLTALKPDGVYVIGKPEQMYDIWTWCLENRFNLFIEKPMGTTFEQSVKLARLAQQNHCITQVSHQRRSAPVMQKMREECLKKGPVIQAMVEFYKNDIRPELTTRDRMLDDYTHCVDTARWICGGEVVKIESHCKHILATGINLISSTLFFDNGSACHVTGNWSSGRRVFRTTMHSTGICAEVEPEKEAWLYAEGNYAGERFDTKAVAGSNELFVYGGFQNKSKEFIESVLSGRDQTSSSFADVLKTMEVCAKILEQDAIEQINYPADLPIKQPLNE